MTTRAHTPAPATGPTTETAAAPAAGTASGGIEIRPVTEAELPEWHRAKNVGFLAEPTPGQAQLDARRPEFVFGRVLGAFDGSRCVATFRSFAQQITAVGGRPVAADAISNVTVSPTHRRRGLLTRMMDQDLAAARERGDVVATLIAAEYPIYGRYGFGPAAGIAEWTVDVPRTGLDPRRSGPDDGGRIDIVDAEDVRRLGPALHERFRRARPGAVSRTGQWWRLATGEVRLGTSWTEPCFAAYRSADGELRGLVSYEAKVKWQGKQPENTAEVNWLLADGPAAERALWHYLCSIDWITEVKSDGRPLDDLLPHFLPDARAARISTLADWLWVRVLDVTAALEARTYGAAGALVLEVTDRDGYAAGRWLLETAADTTGPLAGSVGGSVDGSVGGPLAGPFAGPFAGSCTPTTRDADLTLDAAALASLWLGDESAVRLAALGRVREERAGAAQVADALLRTSRRPWCPDLF
ncbi:GNAT family N-acetyltransferase [Streptomyces sp. NPDC047000]|uniref:GNAT family N-acetyltransferase n=1 Tax=Streptomyces sp. NPDC047000 TaxID=3155474 RepID=UPI0033DF1B14